MLHYMEKEIFKFVIIRSTILFIFGFSLSSPIQEQRRIVADPVYIKLFNIFISVGR